MIESSPGTYVRVTNNIEEGDEGQKICLEETIAEEKPTCCSFHYFGGGVCRSNNAIVQQQYRNQTAVLAVANKRKRKARSTSASGYFGVSLTPSKRYCAYIQDGIKQGLGTYDTAKQAAKAYDAAAIELGRPLSKLNFPNKVPPGYTPINNGQRSTCTNHCY